MQTIMFRSFFVLLLAMTACAGQGTVAKAPAPVSGMPNYVPAALAHVRIPPAPTFAVPRPPDAAMRASRNDTSPTPAPTHYPFFTGEVALSNNVYYLSFASGNPFGYYSYLSDSRYVYHFDAGYEYTFDAADGNDGIYLYDYATTDFWYTSPTFPFPYIYDFTLKSVLYYYPDENNPGHYTTSPRYFYNFNTGRIITM